MHGIRWLASGALLALALMACGSETQSQRAIEESARAQQTTTSVTSTPPAAAPSEAVIDNTAVGGVCADGTNCWQPTHFDSAFVEGESVSLEEQTGPDMKTVTRSGWPNNNDKVEVLCADLNGQVYRNAAGQPMDDWYGIRVPADKLSPKATGNPRLKKAPDGNGNLGFVSAMWVKGVDKTKVPAC